MPAKHVRFTTLSNRWLDPAVVDLHRLQDSARAAEAAGYDLVSHADMVVGDPFLPLLLVAQATKRLGLMTRITCAYTRSPVLLASATGWLDRVSGGRFILGLGPSLGWEVRDMNGEPFSQPARRMKDIITIIRALWGEDVPGVSRDAAGAITYEGPVIQVRGASVDIQPAGRPKILTAAGGPRMLQVAGEVADGVILERVTARYLDWAWEQIEIGARRSGRSLDGFEVCVQFGVVDPNSPASLRRHIASHVMYANFPEWDFISDVSGIGGPMRAIKAAHAAGDEARVEALVLEHILPVMGPTANQPDSREVYLRWLDLLVDRGVTILAVPEDTTPLTRVSLAEAKAHVQIRDTSATQH